VSRDGQLVVVVLPSKVLAPARLLLGRSRVKEPKKSKNGFDTAEKKKTQVDNQPK